jgi:hypothetical protein
VELESSEADVEALQNSLESMELESSEEDVEALQNSLESIELGSSEEDAEAPQNFLELVNLEILGCPQETSPLKTPDMYKRMMSFATACSDMSPQFSPENILGSSPLQKKSSSV